MGVYGRFVRNYEFDEIRSGCGLVGCGLCFFVSSITRMQWVVVFRLGLVARGSEFIDFTLESLFGVRYPHHRAVGTFANYGDTLIYNTPVSRA